MTPSLRPEMDAANVNDTFDRAAGFGARPADRVAEVGGSRGGGGGAGG